MLKKPPVLSHKNMFLVRQLRSLLDHSSCSQKKCWIYRFEDLNFTAENREDISPPFSLSTFLLPGI